MKKRKKLKNRGKQTKSKRKWQKFYFTPSPKISGILIALVLISYGTAAGLKHLMLETQIFVVERVEVQGLKYLDSGEILKLANIELRQPLYHINVDSVMVISCYTHHTFAVHAANMVSSYSNEK